MLDIKNIAIGFFNNTRKEFGLEDSVTEQLAINRYEICLQCPLIQKSSNRCAPKDQGGCNCKLEWKIRSNSKCPKDKW